MKKATAQQAAGVITAGYKILAHAGVAITKLAKNTWLEYEKRRPTLFRF